MTFGGTLFLFALIGDINLGNLVKMSVSLLNIVTVFPFVIIRGDILRQSNILFLFRLLPLPHNRFSIC